MSAVSPPGAKPIATPPVSSELPGVGEAPPGGLVSGDALETGPAEISKSALSGPEKVASPPTVQGIAESFPVKALQKLEAKGIGGQTFMLDAGSLRGLKLEVRRVRDGTESGFELMFQLTESKLPALVEALKQQGASSVPLEFRELQLGEDGIATYGPARSQLSSSSTHAPKDLDGNAAQWALKLEGAKGGTLEVVHDKAALAVRGLVRIQLRGDDQTCSKQLDGLVKSLGLAQVLAPPTDKSKRVFALMRVLWQADHQKASELSKGDLDKLSPKDVEAALLSVGYSQARIDGLRFEEVFEGHFTVVDPEQAKELGRAGARYLYSTVTMPEHVHSILVHGQKSSLQRYKDGLIINGMSTNADFVTGGAQGVFTRLVTQDAIYDNKSWTGRTYKLLQTSEQLGRTDWYGWSGDFFGRRWELESKVNFGVPLVESIDSGGSYKSTNELIFTAGNRPQNIQRVIATSEADRKKLIEHLAAQGYEPHNGLSLEDFVVLSPKFLLFGASPYDASDPEAFIAEAKQKASEGHLGPLAWFLLEGPSAPEQRAALEREILLGADEKQRTVVFRAAKLSGQLALGPALEQVFTELEAKNDPASKTLLESFVTQMPEALFRSGSAKAVELLTAKRSNDASSYQPFGLDDEAWVRLMGALVQDSGEVPKKALALALDVRAKELLTSRHAGFADFLAEHPQVQPADPASFVAEEIAKLKDSQTSVPLLLYTAQKLTPEHRAQLEKELIRANTPSALSVLRSYVDGVRVLAIDGDTAQALLAELPAGSPTKNQLLNSLQDALLKLGHDGVFEALVAHHANSADLGLYDAARWTSVVDSLLSKSGGELTPYLRKVIERGAVRLVQSNDFCKRLPSLEGLLEVGDPAAFVENAINTLNGRGPLDLLWLLVGPESGASHRKAAVRVILESNNNQARNLLEKARELTPGSNLPLSVAQLHELLKELAAKEPKTGLHELLRIGSRQLLTTASLELLPLFDEATKGDAHKLVRFGISGNTLLEVLTAAKARSDADGPAVHQWLLEASARYALPQGDAAVIGHLVNADATLADVGFSVDEAAAQVKSSVDQVNYYLTNASYADTPSYAELPAAAKWLIMQGQPHPDEVVLEAIEKALPGWGWSEALMAAFTKRVPGLSDEWKGRLEAARTKS